MTFGWLPPVQSDVLPALPDTDIFDHQPDSDDIDVLADGFGVNSLPRGVGVYCFYDPKTGAPHYVGSGCGVDPHGTKNCGLVLRIKLYRRPRHVHDLKIHNAIVASGLRHRCSSYSAGRCLGG